MFGFFLGIVLSAALFIVYRCKQIREEIKEFDEKIDLEETLFNSNQRLYKELEDTRNRFNEFVINSTIPATLENVNGMMLNNNFIKPEDIIELPSVASTGMLEFKIKYDEELFQKLSYVQAQPFGTLYIEVDLPDGIFIIESSFISKLGVSNFSTIILSVTPNGEITYKQSL